MLFSSEIWRGTSQKIIKHLNTLPDIRESRIVVALSGGQDSVFLLAALTELRRKYRYELLPLHVNHKLIREDVLYMKLAILTAGKLGWGCALATIKPRPDGKNLEEWMREERYRLLEKYRKKTKAGYVAIAHHENDQAETVLAHIIRGCGPKGLSGMPFRRGKIIRPIIGVPKTDLDTLMRGTNLPYYNDKLNYSLDYQRNKIRHELLPYLKRNFNPQISSCLAKLADFARENSD